MFADKEYSHSWKCNHARLKSLDYTAFANFFYDMVTKNSCAKSAHILYEPWHEISKNLVCASLRLRADLSEPLLVA